MFSMCSRSASAEQVEDYMLVRHSKTTPAIDGGGTGLAEAMAFLPRAGHHDRRVPDLHIHAPASVRRWKHDSRVMILAVRVPLATLVLFFELNTPRNVSLHMVAKLFVFGAVVSLRGSAGLHPADFPLERGKRASSRRSPSWRRGHRDAQAPGTNTS